MANNRKIVHKGFSYLQCDDFADYLSKMATQGWHFKEWGAGLVFEKGEPEDAVYAVEVFIHGSQYDLKPGEHTLNFGDYCEEAGWKMVDAKQKFCIFKQIRPDAVSIVTPEERLKNASKAYRGQLIWQVVLSLLWIGNMLLRFLPKQQLIDSLFSDFFLISAAFWVCYFIFTVAKCIWYLVWLHKAKERMTAGENKFLNQAKETILNWFSTVMLTILLVGLIASGGPVHIIISLATILVIMIPSLLFAKFRPERETFIGFQIVMPIAIMITIIFVSCFSILTTEQETPSLEDLPLVYEDLHYDAGETAAVYHTSSSSILGNSRYYSARYQDASMAYQIYETEQDWILDLIWDENAQTEGTINGSIADCAALWDANAAFHNGRDYFVRYDDTILILRFLSLELTEEHVSVIRDKLGLEE